MSVLMKKVIASKGARFMVVAERENLYECRKLNKQGRINSSQKAYTDVPKSEATVLGNMFPVNHPVLAFSQGYWKNGLYDSIGNEPGEHWVKIDGKRCLIIQNELQYFPDGV